MKPFTLTTSVAALSLALTAAASAQEADVLHYWTSGSEAAALAQIANAFEERGGTWIDSSVAGFEAERTVAMTRFAGGNPPEAMLTELGQETRNLAEAGILRDLSDLAEAGNWTDVLPASVVDALKVDDAIFAVPVDIGARNWMYASTKVFEESGVEIPTSWAELLEEADAIKDAGYIPLALGGEGWQESILFSAVMAGVGGNDFFKSIYEDAEVEAAASETMISVFDTFRALNDLVDEGSPGRAWNDATNLVVTDQAGLIVMGDWAKGEFTGAGKLAGEDFVCDLAPGTANFYDAIVDAFVFPIVGDDAIEGQNMLIDVMMTPEVQVEFNRIKGSLPPRTDADNSALDVCAVKGAETMAAADTYVPSIVDRPTNDVSGQLDDIVSEFWNSPEMTSQEAAERYAEVLSYVE